MESELGITGHGAWDRDGYSGRVRLGRTGQGAGVVMRNLWSRYWDWLREENGTRMRSQRWEETRQVESDGTEGVTLAGNGQKNLCPLMHAWLQIQEWNSRLLNLTFPLLSANDRETHCKVCVSSHSSAGLLKG